MQKNSQKFIILAAMAGLLVVPLVTAAATNIGDVISDLDQTAQNARIITGDPNAAPTVFNIMGRIINVILSVLGAIFLIQMIYGGIKWMTAAGNEETVKKASALIYQSITGLIIVLAAFLLANYVVFKLLGTTAVDCGPGGCCQQQQPGWSCGNITACANPSIQGSYENCLLENDCVQNFCPGGQDNVCCQR